ncbi:cardiolipin synthase [Ottowia sp.]|uniref:cardiolipin synthase n=1 Tax=Ottowia sp. TaxID=1898956 RepID=UPI003A89E95A
MLTPFGVHGVVFLGFAWPLWLIWGWAAAAVALTLWIIMQRKSPVSTLAWIIVVNLLPVVGAIIYATFGPQRIQRQRLKRWHHRASVMSRKDVDALRAEYTEVPVWARQHVALIHNTADLPVSSAQSVDILPSGGATLHALLQEIAQAQCHIHLEYYIFEPDQTGTRLLQALTARARAGVKVRLLVDAVGSPALLSRRHRYLLAEYEAAGGQFAVFHPARLDRLRPLVNLRTHRKIVVVDGRVGFVGGINVTDDENEHLRPDDAYRDTHLLIRGGAVRWLQYVFMQDWQYAEGARASRDEVLLPPEPAGPVPVQIVASGPDSDTEAIHRAVIDALNLARERVWLATPYFVPTEAALLALTNAALRGVQVKLIVPQRSDSLVVSAAARSYYAELQAAGVLVFEYQGRMFHAKTLLVDQYYGMVGSANFDNRSFRLNFEVAAVVLDDDFNQQLAAMFQADLSHCKLVPERRAVSPWQRLFEAVARLASPLL